MKKIIALIITVLCLCAFSVTAAAETQFSYQDDYSKVTYNGVSYTKVNATGFEHVGYETGYNLEILQLNEEQKQSLSEIVLEEIDGDNVISVTYTLNDGGQIIFSYLKDEYIDDYNKAIENKWEKAKVDFEWPDGNIVDTNVNTLKQEKVNLSTDKIEERFWVIASFGDKNFGIPVGRICLRNDTYYYIDYNEAGIKYNGETDIDDFSTLPAYKINDAAIISEFNAARKEYYDDGLGFFDNDSFTKKVADFFIVTLFAVIPFAVGVLFMVLAIRSKTKYRKFFTVISTVAGAELVIFIITAVLLKILKV